MKDPNCSQVHIRRLRDFSHYATHTRGGAGPEEIVDLKAMPKVAMQAKVVRTLYRNIFRFCKVR